MHLHIQVRLVALAARMAGEAPLLLADLRSSVAADAFTHRNALGHNVTCHPYAAGVRECGMLPHPPTHRDSEPWRTYSEALYSGALERTTVAEILEWHQTAQGSGVRGSRLKLGILAGCGGDVSCGDQLETFTLHGWGYGLLLADLVHPYLLLYFAISAHGYTRGTHIAPESTDIDRSKASVPFATPAGLTAPLFLKWLHVFEDPVEHVLWLARATPRVWLSHGQTISVDAVPTAYGQLSFSLVSTIDTSATVCANISLSARLLSRPPPGGIRLRLRVPGPGLQLTRATVGGVVWAAINASDASIRFDAAAITASGLHMQSIVATFVTRV